MEQTMISPAKIFLELILLVAVIVLLRNQGKSQHRSFVLWFAGITFALNILFYYLAAWPLYSSFGQSQGLPSSTLHSMMWFDIVKWGVLAYFCAKFVLNVRPQDQGGGFLFISRKKPLWTVPVVGIVGGVTTTLLIYSLSYAEQYLGHLEALPWPYFKESDVYFKLAIWGGVRNLAGEEILTRLGVQSVLLYVLSKHKFSAIWAILLSSVYFELWHNGFRELYFLNFSASLVFGMIYQKFGYESAATSHCVADWLGLVLIPRLLY